MAQITWLKSLTAVAQVHMNPNINIFTTAELYEGYLEQLYTRRDTNAIQLSAVLGHKWLFWPSSSHRHTRCTSATGPTGISSKLKLSGMYHYVPVFSNLSKFVFWVLDANWEPKCFREPWMTILLSAQLETSPVTFA